MNSDPRVMEWIDGAIEYPEEVIRSRIIELLKKHEEWDFNQGVFAIHQRTSGIPIGWVALKPTTFFPDQIEVGYRLLPRFWGQGYATEAANSALERARSMGLAEVIAITLDRNVRSRHIIEKVGMRLVEEFVFPAWVSEVWSIEERRGVRYELKLKD